MFTACENDCSGMRVYLQVGALTMQKSRKTRVLYYVVCIIAWTLFLQQVAYVIEAGRSQTWKACNKYVVFFTICLMDIVANIVCFTQEGIQYCVDCDMAGFVQLGLTAKFLARNFCYENYP